MEPLPPKEMILEACRSLPRGDHPILTSAHQLAGLHEQRRYCALGSTADIDERRAHFVLTIDRWIATEVPLPHGGAHMHTETVGTVIDRMAQFSICAYAALRTAPDWIVHDAWQRLAELALGYQDLAFEVSAGIRRLPDLGGHRPYSSGQGWL
ncbi:DUF4254 domain-containing protein [Nocardia sp. NBC_01009]|uniref:DUF4254 domain-containing protein n=1 Tax=Nocardia sp. NBC_01009 TaxID=2975996 RepID=UPI00386E73CF|nr:DUF4254 domain-containing protein [Nocardia sp. NBC_01009]